jgi:hypothetical protein
MESDIPPSILKSHPELAAVHEALDQDRKGEPITALCFKCGMLLQLERVAATGAVVVRCPNGDTFFRSVQARR